MVRNLTVIALSAVLVTTAARPAAAQLKAQPGEWPAWRGPDRTGVGTETGLLRQWPAGGPKLLWKITGLGDGYSTPSVAGGRLYLLGTEGREEQILALDVKDGKRIWATKIGVEAGGRPGPRSTPTVDGDLLYVLSSDGKLVCAQAADGRVRWRKDFRADFGGRCGNWAYAESPLIDGDVLVCTPGGEQAALVALNKQTGDVIWKSALTGLKGGGKRAYTTAAYSSAIAAEIDGVRQYVQFLSGGVVGVAAKDGRFLWNYDRPANGTANCSTPIHRDGHVFAASNYGNGGGLAKVTSGDGKFQAAEVYFVSAMQNHHGGMILVGDHVYGTGANSLLCVDFKTGKIAWQERSVGKGSVAYADGLLVVRSEDGPVALVEAMPAGYREKGRFNQPERSAQKAWPHPVIAGGRLYLRDWDTLFCYDVKAP
jgi:outer membrane protein assembly factor BamB